MKELAEMYMYSMTDEELMEWATNEKGEFNK